jgi:integrase
MWAVALGVGLRKGEALGLRWSDIDMKAGRLHVRQSLQRQAGGLVFVEPKTHRSRRTVPLPLVCQSALRAHKLRQSQERLACGPYWQNFDLVFTTNHGTPIDPRNVNQPSDP